MEFLMKMSPKYQHIRSNILMMKDLPSAADSYRILMKEQTHQELSKNTSSEEQETSIAYRVDNKSKYGDKGKFVLTRKEGITVTIVKFRGILWRDVGNFMAILQITNKIHGEKILLGKLMLHKTTLKLKKDILSPR